VTQHLAGYVLRTMLFVCFIYRDGTVHPFPFPLPSKQATTI
jgi:hypothetical protein